MNLKKWQQQIADSSIEYGSLPFWSWNDRLKPEELRRQIARMDELGMRGFFMHARGGLETEYLSDEWYECIEACVDEAKKRGMEAWSYDENGWPSGFAGGKLLEDERNWAHFLALREDDVFPSDALAVYVAEGEGYLRITSPVEGAHYYIIERKSDPSYVDTFDPSVTDRFIALTHACYKERLDGEDFGKAMPGFFTDEPQYFRYATPWSDTFPAIWREEKGEDILDGLIALFKTFPDYELFRYDYHLMMHRRFIDAFGKRIYDWCEENGCQLTGHAVEEGALHAQMWSCGGILPFYRYEHIPGIDYLGRNLSDDVPAKQLGSVCAQTGRKKALSEMFACCGWDVTPTELKKIAELQYAGGVNVMCQHLYAYSLRGQRKRDYPANYSEHLPWQDDMAAFDRYFNHLGYTLSRGEEMANVLVIHPIRSCYLTYKRDEDYQSVKDVEDAFHALSNLLSQNQILYHWGDESMLADLGSVQGDSILLGKCRYDRVIIPYAKTLDGTTVALLRRYLENGGRLWLYADAPTRMDGRPCDLSFLRSNITFDQLMAERAVKVTVNGASCPDLRLMVRQTEEGRILYLVNRSDNAYPEIRLDVTDCSALLRLDMHSLRSSAVRGGQGCFTLALEGAESAVMLESDDAPDEERPVLGKPLSLDGTVFRLDGEVDNAILLDNARLSKNGGELGELLPVMAIKDRLLRERFEGEITLSYPFRLSFLPRRLMAVIEPIKGMRVTVNGRPISPAEETPRLDRSFLSYDLASAAKEGDNELSISLPYFQRDYVYYVLYGGVSESLRNCLWFDTEIECVTLVGDFAVMLDENKLHDAPRHAEIYEGASFALSPRSDVLNVKDLVRDGYPFFAGEIRAKTTLLWHEGMGDELWLGGRYAVARVEVNGVEAGRVLFTDHISLRPFLREGENTLALTLVNSNRNLLGPHHNPDPEPWGVGPGTFSCESSFDERGVSPHYLADRYSFVRFGVDFTAPAWAKDGTVTV